MKRRAIVCATVLFALTLVVGSGSAFAAKPPRLDLKTKLRDPRSTQGVHGSAEYKVRADHSRIFRVVVYGVRNKKNQAINVFVNGSMVGTLTQDTTTTTTYSLTLDTRTGATIPDIKPGDTVDVKRMDGKVIATGTF